MSFPDPRSRWPGLVIRELVTADDSLRNHSVPLIAAMRV